MKYNKKTRMVTDDGFGIELHWKHVVYPLSGAQLEPVTAEQMASVQELVGTIISRGTVDLLKKRGYTLEVAEEMPGGAFVTLRGARHPAGVKG